MTVRIIKWKNVIDHCQSDLKMLSAFNRFHEVVKNAKWKKPQDVILTLNSTDIITCSKEGVSRLVFNIGSNKYRLITGYHFSISKTVLYIKFVGTHKEYDKIDTCKIDMFKSK